MADISTIIRAEIDTWEKTFLSINPSFAPRQQDILELIDLYWMSKYQKGDRDSSGWRRTFYNIVENPTLVASKIIDLDTKDIRIIAEDGQSYWPSWFFQKELKLWMKENLIGKLLNEIIFSLPKYGHIVLKKVNSKLELVNLRNIIIDQTVRHMKGNVRIERHQFSASELESMGRELNWQDVEIVLASDTDQEGKYVIYERFDPLAQEENYHIVFLGKEGKSVVLASGKIDDPYREHKWEDLVIRWLGRGQVEKLFDNQIAANEGENMFRQGLQWSSKRFFQTRDETIARNLFTEAENGELFRVQSEITNIPMEERNLSAYRYADEKWAVNTDKRTFAFDVVRGERLPAGTPLGSALLQSQMAGSFFELKQEELGLFLKDLILNDIIPEFKKQKKAEHFVNLLNLGQDDVLLDGIQRNRLNHRMNRRIIQHVARKGKWPVQGELDLFKLVEGEKLKRPEESDTLLPEGFYDNLKYKIDIVVTQEQVDIAAKLTTLQTVLQIMATNPTIMQDKRTKRIFFKMLDMVGVNPEELDVPEEIGVEQIVAERGGSTARVAAPSLAPTALKTSTVL